MTPRRQATPRRDTTSRHERSLAATAAAALLVVGAVHLIDGPASLGDQFYIGALELALAAAAVPLALILLIGPRPVLWSGILLLNLTALGFYVASRTVGLPGSSDDIGNWGQLLGVVNVLSELTVIGVASLALAPRARAHKVREP